MDRQVYDSKSGEWVWWYMLIIVDSDGSNIECNDHNEHLAYDISINENLGKNQSSQLSSNESPSSSWELNQYSGGSSYSSSDSSSSSSDD